MFVVIPEVGCAFRFKAKGTTVQRGCNPKPVGPKQACKGPRHSSIAEQQTNQDTQPDSV